MENDQRKADVFIQRRKAGIICETDDGYLFSYNKEYLAEEDAVPASLTLPLRGEPYRSSILFPFFDGLIPEGWLLNVVSTNWKINTNDRFGLLLKSCRDCIGDVQIVEISGTKGEEDAGSTGEKISGSMEENR